MNASRKKKKPMAEFDQRFWDKWKNEMDIELAGVVSVGASTPKEFKEKVSTLLPGTKSVIVMGKEIYKEVVALLEPSKEVGEAAGGDLFGPHSGYLDGQMNNALYKLANLLRNEGYRSLPLPAGGCPTDMRSLSAVFSYKHAAQLAGLGTLGRNSLLITPDYGPRVRLACLLTEAAFEASPISNKEHCTHCNKCIQACPAQSLLPPEGAEVYNMNKFACRAYRQTGLTCGVCIKACDEARA
jgi:epoxyqueuosine reductase